MSDPHILSMSDGRSPSPSPVRMLVIDDNPSIHDDFRKILCGNGDSAASLHHAEAALFGESPPSQPEARFEIDSAFQGQEGLQKVHAALAVDRPYIVAFVDIRMPPGWDGIETIERIWKVDPSIQVVICTAFSDYSWEQITQRLGISDSLLILKKPFDNVEVLQLAHTLSTKWQLNRQARMRIEDLDRAVAERTAALKLSEERFARAFLASPVPLALQSCQEQRFLDVNHSFLEMLGYQRAEVIGTTPEQLSLFPEALLRSQIAESIRIRAPIRARQCQFRAKSGNLRTVLFSAEPLGMGTEDCLLVLAYDITERTKLEAQLRQAQKMEAIGQLAAGVAHDFNNLLTVITGHVQLALGRPNLETPLQEALKIVCSASERAATLTRQLLAFSRKQLINPRPLDICLVLDQLSKMLQSLLGETIQLRLERQPDLPLILADPGSVEQVMVNLAVNARDAMPNGGQLVIRMERSCIGSNHVVSNPDAQMGEFVCVSVSDSGCGMDAETLSRLFEPFFTTKDVGQGTGLGLATAYGIVRQHNGWIEAASEPGKGATFRVFFPRSSQPVAPEPVTPQTPRVAPNPPPANFTILLVEDEHAVRHLAERLLRRLGYSVLSAANAQDALRVWEEKSKEIDVVLTDMVMPGGLSGRDLAARLTSDCPQLPVIYTSGYSVDFQPGGLKLEEGINFLAKPYNPETLANILARISGNQRN